MLSSYICSTVVMTLVRSARRAAGACLLPLLLPRPPPRTGPRRFAHAQAAMDRALAANPTIAAARLRRAINLAGLAVAGERLNPGGHGRDRKGNAEAGVRLRGAARAWRQTRQADRGERGDHPRRRRGAGGHHRADRATTSGAHTTTSSSPTRGWRCCGSCAICRSARAIPRRRASKPATRRGSRCCRPTSPWPRRRTRPPRPKAPSIAARSRLNALLGQPLDTVQTLSTAIDAGGPVVAERGPRSSRARAAPSSRCSIDGSTSSAPEVALAEALRVPDIMPTATLTHDAEPEFTYGWRAGVAVTLPIFTTHKAGVLVEQATLDAALGRTQATLVRINGEVTAAAAAAEAQRLAYVRYRDRHPAAGAGGRAAGAGLISARPDRHRGAAAGAAGVARRPPARRSTRSRNSRRRSPISSAPSERRSHDPRDRRRAIARLCCRLRHSLRWRRAARRRRRRSRARPSSR